MPQAFVLLLLLQGPSTAPVVINEFNYDDQGTDNLEFVELYNRSGAPIDISGWTVDFGDSTACASVCTTPGCLGLNNNPDAVIPPATILPAGGYWVIGLPAVPGVNQAIGFIENDQEWITLRDAASAVVDTVGYEMAKLSSCFPAAAAEGPGVFGNNQLIEGIATPYLVPQNLSVSRVINGYDSDNNGRDFALLPWTPGAANDPAGALPFSDDFDALAVGTFHPAFRAGFTQPVVVDPTVSAAPIVPPYAAGFNTTAIPASPQGGNAMVMWDPTGGGNSATFVTTSTDRIEVECYVYFDPTNPSPAPTAGGEFETWSLGVQGTTDSFGNNPNPGAVLTNNGVTGLAEPNTGIAWEFVVYTEDAATGGATTALLVLVDENDGGFDNTVLGTIAITPGVNDGWQRLRLRVNGSKVDGWFGGPLGTTEGVHISGTASMPGPGTVYLQYREFVTANSLGRPLTLDALTIRAAEAGVDFVTPPTHCFGSGGCAPSIGWSGGDASLSAPGPFSIDLSRANSPAAALLVIGVVNTGLFPLDLGLLFPPASAPCYLLQDFPIQLALGAAGGGACVGTASVVFPSLAGAAIGSTVYAQYGVVDLASPLGFPIVVSDGLAVTIQP